VNDESDGKEMGDSAVIWIPVSIMAAMRLGLDEVVEVRGEAGQIVIEPVRQKTYDLDDLLKGVTPENLHEPIHFGPPEGKEVW
jgi:antitoxin MazE